jgi:hypothetical protein
MIEYSSNKYGKWRRVDISALWLGDNLASDMTQQRLYAELTDAGVPRIADPRVGRSQWQDRQNHRSNRF